MSNDFTMSSFSIMLPAAKLQVVFVGKGINNLESNVMPVATVTGTWIAQTNDKEKLRHEPDLFRICRR
jgi:hypothetical protein